MILLGNRISVYFLMNTFVFCCLFSSLVLFGVMRHGWIVLSEKGKGPIFVHFRAMRHGWQVSHGLSGD